MDERYDRIVRNVNELVAFRDYIALNPEKAGLSERHFTLRMNDRLRVEP